MKQNGYQVPGDVSVVGFDDLPFCAISSPPLTTIKVYNREMGRAAVRRLVELAKHGGGLLHEGAGAQLLCGAGQRAGPEPWAPPQAA